MLKITNIVLLFNNPIFFEKCSIGYNLNNNNIDSKKILYLKSNLSKQIKPLLLLLFSTAALIFGYIAEYKGIKPCVLCIYQRYILLGLVVSTLISLLIPTFYYFSRFLLFFSFFFNVYQIGVEQKFFKLPEFCKQNIEINDNENLYHALERNMKTPNTKYARCDKSNWKIYNVSATNWFAVLLLIVILWTKR